MSESWLEALEDKVREAALELSRHRDEAAELRQRAEELEAKVVDLETRLEAAEAATGDDAATAAWLEERDAIRERVERLADHLGDLLDGSS